MPRVTLGMEFPYALREVRDKKFKGSTNAMAEYCGINTVMLTHYCTRGKTGRFPSVDTLEKLLLPFGTEIRRKLLKAYLVDHVPLSLGDLVKMSDPNGRKVVKPRYPKDTPPPLKHALERLAHYGTYSKEICHMVLALDKLMFSVRR